MAKLFFLLSGEHENLPTAELKAILEAENHPFKIAEKLDQTLRLEAELNCVEAIKRRAAFTRLCASELFTCKAEINEIVKTANAMNLNEILENSGSFAVRVKHIKNHCSHIDSMALERKLGEIILNKKANAKVNLKNPEKTFFGVLTDGKFVFGVKIAEFPPKQFVDRRPKNKPFFHPSAMPAKLARCMVNLAKPKTGELVLDPFCGTGGILVEAALIGCRILGLDIQRRMAKGANKNMKHFNINPEGIVVADAGKPPITKVDCVVADPPYGRSASTMKRTTKQIVEEFLEATCEMLSHGKRVCIAAPKTLNVASLAATFGYRHLESHFVYVHRSLTREIAVFEKA